MCKNEKNSRERQFHILSHLLPLSITHNWLPFPKWVIGFILFFFMHHSHYLENPYSHPFFILLNPTYFSKTTQISPLWEGIIPDPPHPIPVSCCFSFFFFYVSIATYAECLSYYPAITGLLAFLLHQSRCYLQIKRRCLEQQRPMNDPKSFKKKLWQCIHLLNTLTVVSNGHSLKLLCAQKWVFIYKDTEILLKAQW